MEIFKTKGGKKIELYYVGFSIRARFIGGGELPEELAGQWTDEPSAKISILKYLDRKSK